MDKKAQLSIGVIVLVIMGVFVGLALFQEIGNQQPSLTTKISVPNESVNYTLAFNSTNGINTSYAFELTNAPSGWKQAQCPLENVVVRNASTVFTVTTDYTINTTNGTLLFQNSSNVQSGGANLTNVTYDYCHDGYNVNSGSRGIARIIALFAGLGLVVFVAAYGLRQWMRR